MSQEEICLFFPFFLFGRFTDEIYGYALVWDRFRYLLNMKRAYLINPVNWARCRLSWGRGMVVGGRQQLDFH
jgi:hypothetical protein